MVDGEWDGSVRAVGELDDAAGVIELFIPGESGDAAEILERKAIG